MGGSRLSGAFTPVFFRSIQSVVISQPNALLVSNGADGAL